MLAGLRHQRAGTQRVDAEKSEVRKENEICTQCWENWRD